MDRVAYRKMLRAEIRTLESAAGIAAGHGDLGLANRLYGLVGRIKIEIEAREEFPQEE